MRLSLVKPSIKSLNYDEVNHVESIEISPLDLGLARGVFGNSLRTALLSLVPGFAITNFMISYKNKNTKEMEKKLHIFDTIPGVTPALDDVSLNLKSASIQLRNGLEEKDITINKKGPCVVTLKDFETEGIKILNPDLEIFTIVDDTEVELTIKVKEGRGYKEEICFDEDGWISLDANFSPVLCVKTEVEPMRVNGEDGFEKVILTITTNGKLSPKEALSIAIKINLEAYKIFEDESKKVIDNEPIYFDVEEDEDKPTVFRGLDDMGLSVRAYNALSAKGINNTEDFKRYTRKEIRDIPNLGKKTFEEIEEVLAALNIELRKS